MVPVIIAFGSNEGDSLRSIVSAREHVVGRVNLVGESAIYLTKPMYFEQQNDFYNGVWLGKTSLSPRSLMSFLKGIEQQMGRVRTVPNGPRPIDLDLILYGSLAYRFFGENGSALVVPHPGISERRFVLEPLLDVLPQASIPCQGLAKNLLDSVKNQEVVNLGPLDRLVSTNSNQ